MKTFLLMIWLYQGGPEMMFEVESCEVGYQWWLQALLWADRSGIDRGGPGYLCDRGES
jgi:hypothetical protein